MRGREPRWVTVAGYWMIGIPVIFVIAVMVFSWYLRHYDEDYIQRDLDDAMIQVYKCDQYYHLVHKKGDGIPFVTEDIKESDCIDALKTADRLSKKLYGHDTGYTLKDVTLGEEK